MMKLANELWYYVNHVSNKLRKYIQVEPTMMPFISPSCAVYGLFVVNNPDSKVQGAYMGPTWGQQDPGGPHVGPMNFAIREDLVPW